MSVGVTYWVFACSQAWAEPSQAQTHWGIGVGAFGTLVGPVSAGFTIQTEVYPATFGRWGGQAAVRRIDDATLISAGPTYTAGASRPKLHLALHGEAAITIGGHMRRYIGIGGGVMTQLWVRGPVALGVDMTAHIFARNNEPELMLSSSITIRAAQ